MLWQRDCRDRWRKLESIFRVNFILKNASAEKGNSQKHQNSLNNLPDEIPPVAPSDRQKTRVGKFKLKRRSLPLLGNYSSLKGTTLYGIKYGTK